MLHQLAFELLHTLALGVDGFKEVFEFATFFFELASAVV